MIRRIIIAENLTIDYLENDEYKGLRVNNDKLTTSYIINTLEEGITRNFFSRNKLIKELLMILFYLIK